MPPDLTSRAAATVVTPALDLDRPRGGLTVEQVADLALRCGRAETRAREAEAQHRYVQGTVREALEALARQDTRIAELEAFLVRACTNGGGTLLREAGLS